MSSEERRKILQMVADGKITAEEAANLMRTLEEAAEEEIQVVELATDSWSQEKIDAPEFEEVRRRASRFSRGILGLGILFTVLSAWVMFSIQQNNGLNFWFFCFAMPFIFGVMLISLGAGAKSSRWLYVNVDRTNAEDWPRKISIAFPLPLGLASWFIRNFGQYIDGFKKTSVDEIINAINLAKTITEPLIVNVDESDKGGERVQVFIG